MARSQGVVLVLVKNPGKVGAFRVYCPDLMKRGQFVVMIKNTAASVAVPGTANTLIGTNPLCIGLPDSDFIYDASMSTVATNKMRIKQKAGERFAHPIGVNDRMRPTKNPQAILEQSGALWPFSHGDYWYKSFFLGVAIEAISAMVGGRTQIKTQPQRNSRLFSDEGLMAIVVDRSVFPEYANYLKEWPRLRRQLKRHKIRIPGSYNERMGRVRVLKEDWEHVNRL
jgi:LDH2 family malate/lactate/ureidoglycolate dehydrogenase